MILPFLFLQVVDIFVKKVNEAVADDNTDTTETVEQLPCGLKSEHLKLNISFFLVFLLRFSFRFGAK